MSASRRRSRSLRHVGIALGIGCGAFVTPRRADAQQASPAPAPRLTRPPTLQHFVEANYPDAERAAGRTADVVLRIQISVTGSVDAVSVIESAGSAFDAAAMDAARHFTFTPAEIDGHPSPIRIAYRYSFTLASEAPRDAQFDGVVLDRAVHRPLAGITVRLETGTSATTDDNGHFHFDGVSPGEHTVTLEGPRITTVRTPETFTVGQQLQTRYEVSVAAPQRTRSADDDDMEIVVSAPPLRRQAVSTEISADAARRVPGTQGDVLRVVENMPGVARASAGSAQLIVWGAAPGDTRVFVDGVPIPRLYHDGGLRSVLASDLVQSVELVPGGYGPAYGRGLGGLVRVGTRAFDEPGIHGSLGLDVYDTSISMRAATGATRVAVAYRHSHLAELLTAVNGNAGDYFPVPHYQDGFARVSHAFSSRERIDLTGLFSTDRIARTNPSLDPQLRSQETREVSFYRIYARYQRQLDDGATVSVIPFVGVDNNALSTDVGGVRTSLQSRSIVGGLRANWRGRVAPFVTVEAGLDAEVRATDASRRGSLALPGREGDVRVFGQQPPDQLVADTWNTTSLGLAPYVETDFELFARRLHIIPGLRVDPYVRSANRRAPVEGDAPSIGAFTQAFQFEPRITVRVAPTPRITLDAAAGLYHQDASPDDLSATFGNPLLPVAQMAQALLAASIRLTETLGVEVTGFVSSADHLAVRSDSPSPARAEALVGTGEGRAYGGQILLRQQSWHGLFGWVSYSLMRSERCRNNTAAWRAFDYDQTHALTAVLAYQLPLGFEVGLRFRLSNGFPRTPVTGAWYDATRDLYQPVFGAQNTERLPLFVQLDARIAKRTRIAGTDLEIYLDVQNVTNQSNAEEIVYNHDYSRSGYITGLPILPVLGARWTF